MKSISVIICLLMCSFAFGGEWAPPGKPVFIAGLPYQSVKSDSEISVRIKATSLKQEDCKIYIIIENKSESAHSWMSITIDSVGQPGLQEKKGPLSGTIFPSRMDGAAPGKTGEIVLDLADYFELRPGLHHFDLKIGGFSGRAVGMFANDNLPLEILIEGIAVTVQK